MKFPSLEGLLTAAERAHLDQLTAGDLELAARVAAYHNGLVAEGLDPDEALQLAVYFQYQLLAAEE